MKQSDLNRAIAHATGESVRFVRQRGFGLLIVTIPPKRRLAQAVEVQAQGPCVTDGEVTHRVTLPNPAA